MPIFLRPPQEPARGPDGQGWNRLTIAAHYWTPRSQCALRPRSWETLIERQNTLRAQWGGFGPCNRDGQCDSCPVFETRGKSRRTLESTHDRVLVRVELVTLAPAPKAMGLVVESVTIPWVMSSPDPTVGWRSDRTRWDWDDLGSITEWSPGRFYIDEHSEGFWLERIV